jgi:hypothetical protein
MSGWPEKCTDLQMEPRGSVLGYFNDTVAGLVVGCQDPAFKYT